MQNDYSKVRETVACFTGLPACSVTMKGDGAEACLNKLFAKDVEAIVPLKGMIGLFLEENGDVFAMSSVSRDEDDTFIVFSERAELKDKLMSYAADDIEVADLAETHNMINIIGPKAVELMTDFAGDDIISIPYMGFEESYDGDYVIYRQGFVGEFEFRLLVPNEGLDELYAKVVEATAQFDGGEIHPEILRMLSLEMRFIKDSDVIGKATALEAGLHWMIDFRKEDFVGRDAVLAQKADLQRRAFLVKLQDTGVAKEGSKLTIETKVVGELARVEYSPTLKSDIGFAYLEKDTGWVGVNYAVESDEGQKTLAAAVSSPVIMARSILND